MAEYHNALVIYGKLVNYYNHIITKLFYHQFPQSLVDLLGSFSYVLMIGLGIILTNPCSNSQRSRTTVMLLYHPPALAVKIGRGSCPQWRAVAKRLSVEP